MCRNDHNKQHQRRRTAAEGGRRQRRRQCWRLQALVVVLMATITAIVQFIVLSNHLGREEDQPSAPSEEEQLQQHRLSALRSKEGRTSNASVNPAIPQSLFVPLLQRNVTVTTTRGGPIVPVVLYPYVVMGSMGKQDATVSLDGLLESPFLQLVSNISAGGDPDLVWIADQGAARAPPPIWCRNFVKVIREVQAQQPQNASWPVHIVQVSLDSPTFHRCKAAERLFAPGHVAFFKRSLIVKRQWNETKQWVDIGRYTDNEAFTHKEQRLLHHLGMPVRTDIVQELDRVLRDDEKINMTLASPIEEIFPRGTDVAHFWPLQDDRVEEFNRVDGRLRDAVSHAIAELHNVTIPDSGKHRTKHRDHRHRQEERRSLRLFVDTIGAGRDAGRSSVQMEYLHKLLDTKIVVVAQRDGWEDHYRLLEGIVAGACVFTDVMLTLPKGLENGTSVVEYSSASNLQDLLLYYLTHEEERIRIAKAGRNVAMRRHRSWHRMEEVVFGRPVSVCEPEQSIEICNPWVVHAKDIYSSKH